MNKQKTVWIIIALRDWRDLLPDTNNSLSFTGHHASYRTLLCTFSPFSERRLVILWISTLMCELSQSNFPLLLKICSILRASSKWPYGQNLWILIVWPSSVAFPTRYTERLIQNSLRCFYDSNFFLDGPEHKIQLVFLLVTYSLPLNKAYWTDSAENFSDQFRIMS